MNVLYDSRNSACKTPFGALKTGESATFTLRLAKTLQARTPVLRLFLADLWDAPLDLPMKYEGGDLVYNAYSCAFCPEAPALYLYRFIFSVGEDCQPVSRGRDGQAFIGHGDMWQLTVYDAAMETPPCLTEGVLYQIFPDRFYCSGQPKRDVPADRSLHSRWSDMPDWRPNELGQVTNSDYFGGDLKGIAEKLDYLVSLGVTAIYLNPIFEAHSNHRYNTADYLRTDPLLGDNGDFAALCAEAGARGIAVLIDGVFSHTGSDSVYFNKEGRYGPGGAYNDPISPYLSWYRFRRYPDDYECWWNFVTLPNVEETDPSYLDFICGEDGVLRHWLRLGASGFRLDVADELPDAFLDRLHLAVKEQNPDAAIIGEVWEDASNKISYGSRRRYLLGRQLDSVMNYPFKDAILRYIRCGNGAEFYGCVMGILENYPQPVIPALMNSLSTHDTPRAITMLAGEEMGAGGRDWQAAHHDLPQDRYDLGVKLLILASVLQFGLPGIPCIYYGDEAGVCGYKDPFNRTCFPWDEEDPQVLESIRALGRVRRDYPFFSRADFVPLVFGDGLCAFTRSFGEYTLLFAVNRQGVSHPLPLSPEGGGAPLFLFGQYAEGTLAPYSGVVLLWQSPLP